MGGKSGVRADFIFDIRLMNTYGAILRGYTDFDYYQADTGESKTAP
jgi:hypothetical protein